MAKSQGTTTYALPPAGSVVIPELDRLTLTPAELKVLKALVAIHAGATDAQLVVSANRQHRIGRVVIRDVVISVAPPLAPRDFVDLVLYASSGRLVKLAEREPAPTRFGSRNSEDLFLILMALLLVRLAEEVLATHVARLYIERTSRSAWLRGRPLWDRDFGHHPAEGISCRFHSLETDVLCNRVILRGLRAADAVLRTTEWASRATSQLFLWRSLASDLPVTPVDCQIAESELNRITEHYRPALVLARSLLFGSSPLDLFANGDEWLQGLQFDLASLFERFVFRIVENCLAGHGVRTAYQAPFRSALLGYNDEIYRSVRPDIVIYSAGMPVGVIDAKYKTRYVEGEPGRLVDPENRITNEDIYQLLFYQAMLRGKTRTTAPPPAVIVAPLLDGRSASSPEYRKVRWVDERDGTVFAVSVVPLRLSDVLRRLRDGASALDAIDANQELGKFLRSLITHHR